MYSPYPGLFLDSLASKGDVSSTMSTLLEVFLQFFALGCTCFGGPVAHLGYFYERFVQRERWLTADAYSDLARCVNCCLDHRVPRWGWVLA